METSLAADEPCGETLAGEATGNFPDTQGTVMRVIHGPAFTPHEVTCLQFTLYGNKSHLKVLRNERRDSSVLMGMAR